MEDWPLIFNLINILHLNLKIPVTAKMRVYESVEKTIAYAQLLERAGAQIITVHGRTRAMKGHHTGLADWEKIKAVKKAVKVPVFANGNVLYPQDFYDALAATGADGIMSAEGNLYNLHFSFILCRLNRPKCSRERRPYRSLRLPLWRTSTSTS